MIHFIERAGIHAYQREHTGPRFSLGLNIDFIHSEDYTIPSSCILNSFLLIKFLLISIYFNPPRMKLIS